MAEELKPDTQSESVKAQAEAVALCRTVYGGTKTMRAAKTAMLPQFPLEFSDDYDRRLSTAVLFNAFARTVRGLVGMVMRKPPVLGDDVPDEIAGSKDGDAEERSGGAWENIDLAGRHGSVFAKDVLTDALVDGHAVIFVDMPPAKADAKSLADEQGRRPYFVEVRKADIVRASAEIREGKHVLTSFAFKECVSVPSGDFGDRREERVRDYRLVEGKVVFRVYAKVQTDKAGEQWVLAQPPGVMTIDRIPAAVVYANRTGYFESEPPLLDLAYENVRHYQLRSDRDNTLHICGVPIWVEKGTQEEGKTQSVGATRGLALPLDGDAKYVEPSGAALNSTRDELQDSESRMATLGLSMLKRETRAAETAEAKHIDKSEADSALGSVATNLQDGLEEAFGFFAKWRNVEDGGSVTVNDDFEGLALDAQTASFLHGLVKTGDLSVETLWDRLVAGRILPKDFDRDAELERVEKSRAKDMAALPRMPFGQPPVPPKPNGPPKPGDPPAGGNGGGAT